MATFRNLHSKITRITQNRSNRGEEERIQKIGKLISAILHTLQIFALQHSHPQPPVSKAAYF